MRKVIGYLLMSLDGVVEEPGDWLEHFDEDVQQNMIEVINAQDAVLLGRGMYQEWARYWPATKEEPAFADFINPVHKYVVSTTLQQAEWNNSTIINGDIAAEIARLKEQPGRDLLVFGSGRLAGTLKTVRPFIVTADWTPGASLDAAGLRARLEPAPRQLSLF